MKITFYHWGAQCPIIVEMLELFHKDRKDTVTCIDFTKREDVALQKQLYYPFLTVFNDTIPWYGPVNAEILEAVRNKKLIKEEPFLLSQSNHEAIGELIPLTKDTIQLAGQGCTLCEQHGQMEEKAAFLCSCGVSRFGLLHRIDGNIVGGVEWLPSLKVPYPIPRDAHTAFLTCVYHSSEQADYKSWPLKQLEAELKKSYQRILVISDELGTFPNGPMQWFISRGYRDLGLLQELEGYARLHLMEKVLTI